MNYQLSPKSVYQLGIQLLDIYQEIHSAGYTYNDLKLDNILVGDRHGQNLNEIRLCDFGFSEKFRDKSGHLK